MLRSISAFLMLAGMLAAGGFNTARAETTECIEIVSVPIQISVQGVYCLKQHLGTNIQSGAAIYIITNNVTIDFNGFKLGGIAAGSSTQADGVRASNRRNISLRNGTIRGFSQGVHISATNADNSSGHVIEDMRLEKNTYRALALEGRGVIARNNLITETGGSTAFGSSGGAHAISVQDSKNALIVNNVIADTFGTANVAIGIWAAFSSRVIIRNNRITNTRGFESGGDQDEFGILFGADDVVVQGNTVINAADLAGDVGIGIGVGADQPTCQNNTVIHFDSGIRDSRLGSPGCNDAGGNVYVPTPVL